jgi:O-antigen ligase
MKSSGYFVLVAEPSVLSESRALAPNDQTFQTRTAEIFVPSSLGYTVFDAARWAFLATLIFAPWAYGCTEPWAISWLESGLAIVALGWVVGGILKRRWPAIHPLMLAAVALLLLQGWWMTCNPHFRHDSTTHLFSRQASWLPQAPGTVDSQTSRANMLRITALLFALCFASDLARNPQWRKRVWWTIGLTGASVILFGLAQKALGATMIFFAPGLTRSAFFGTFYYSGNAGAFINLVLPIIAGLLDTAARERNQRAVGCWIAGLVICVAGALMNTSRAALVVTAILIVTLTILQLNRRKIIFPLAGILGAAAVSWCIGWNGITFQKWSLLRSQLTGDNSRLLAAQAGLRMLPDAGLWGFGPGTFEIAFPHYTQFLGNRIAGVWRYAHNDYLQALIEWGCVGTILWGTLFFGAVMICLRRKRDARVSLKNRAPDSIMLRASGVALLGVALHALVDFPLQIASLQLLAVTYAGVAWGSLRTVSRQKPH